MENKTIKILIVDDELEILSGLRKLFKRRPEFDMSLESDPEKALILLRNNSFHILLADLKLGAKSGIDLCRSALEFNPRLGVIIISGYGTVESGVEAIKSGAFDFIEKPFTAKRLFESIDNLTKIIFQKDALQKSNEANNFYGIIYKSKEIADLISSVKKIANADTCILIEGESGTGKDLFARAIHKVSERNSKPFLPVNCGALPDSLFESELFGHEKGAFTGALTSKPGLLEFADTGTFFFDEISQLPNNLQVKLLRMLEDKKIRRVGGHEEIKLNIRIIAATNENLENAVASNRFRKDLYFRLANFQIKLLPLRERTDDIIPLFLHYLNEFAATEQIKPKSISEAVKEILLNYDWPGNVRELINTVNKIYLLSSSEIIQPDDLPFSSKKSAHCIDENIFFNTYPEAKENVLENFNIAYLKHHLARNNGNISRTASECLLDRRTIHRLITKYNIFYKDKDNDQ